MGTSLAEKKEIRLLGMKPAVFAVTFIILILAIYFDFLPPNLAGQIPFCLMLGELLSFVGDRIPIVKDYLGGGSVVCLLGGAALVYFGILPTALVEETDTFISSTWMNYALAALCCGSIFGMDRKTLLKAAVRYIPCILGGVIVALGLAGLFGAITGYGGTKAALFIGLPIMGGGTSAGAVPMSQMFAETLGVDSGEMLATMTPAVALGNAIAIVCAGLLDKVGKVKPGLTGNGQMMRNKNAEEIADEGNPFDARPVNNLGVCAPGMVIAGLFLGLGLLINKFVPSVHGYAWMILLMVIAKCVGILPEEQEYQCYMWYKFFIKNFTKLLLAAVGIGLIDFGAVLQALTPMYILLCLVTVVGAVIGAGLVGHILGFYFVEGAITGGLCMANMGGSGDIATLGAAKRMVLMPFAAISSRLGGALILILGSILLPLLS